MLKKIIPVKTEPSPGKTAKLVANREHLSEWFKCASLNLADSNLRHNFLCIQLNVNHIISFISHKTLIIDNMLTLLVHFGREPKIVYLDFHYLKNQQIIITKPVGHSILPVLRSKRTLNESAIEKKNEITGYS